MFFEILGPLQVHDEHGVVQVGGPKPRAVLAVLLLHANRPVSAEHIAMALWGPDAAAGATRTVQVHVSRLRKALAGACVIETTPAGYRISLEPEQLDAARFARLVAEGRERLEADEAERSSELLREALALWRGRPLADLEFEPFAQAEIARLGDQQVSALEARIEADLRCGRHAACVDELERLVVEYPARERFASQLMVALYRCGRQAHALEAYRDVRRRLNAELGIEPGPELREVQRQVLAHDPALELPEPPAPETMLPDPPERGDAMRRKSVTILVARLTSHGRSYHPDPEVARRLVELGRDAARQVVQRHRGELMDSLAGELVCIFGLEAAREDDALRALRAAAELRERIEAILENEPAALVMRAALDSGEVIAESAGGRLSLFGRPVDESMALARTTSEGEITLTEATRRLAPDAVCVAAAGPGTWTLHRVIAGAPPVRARHTAPMVGRERELEAALAALDRARTTGTAQLLTVIGEAGVGKSRLAEELARRSAEQTTTLTVQCGAYGEGTAMWPLREALTGFAGGESCGAIRALFGPGAEAQRAADLVYAALGLVEQQTDPERVPWAFRRLFEALAQHGPLLLIVEDMHAADPPLLDLIEYLAEWLTSPALVLCLARPEVLDERPRWVGGRVGVSSLVLAPLEEPDAGRLLESLAGAGALDATERDEVLRAAEGNPLFIEQLLALRGEGDGADLGRRIPPTVESLLAARLDRLGIMERLLIERAAVIGREFATDTLIAMVPAAQRSGAETHLRMLVHRGLVAPDRVVIGEDRLRFHHGLIRDVAYYACPKTVRARLHEQLALTLERRAGDVEEVVGYHFEQAFRYRSELERPSPETLALAGRAGDRLAAAGQRALARGDLNPASRLLQRAVDLLEAAEQTRPEVLLALGCALADSWDPSAAENVLRAALDAARAAGAATLVARASIALSNQRVLLDSGVDVDAHRRIAEEAVDTFTRHGDEAGLALAWTQIGLAHWIRCRYGEMETALGRALGHTVRGGDSRERSEILAGLMRAIVLGPCRADTGIERCRELQEGSAEDVVLSTLGDVMIAVLEAMQARVGEARARYQHARERLSEMGLSLRVAGLETYGAMIELIAGDPGRAGRALEDAYSTLAQRGERGRVSTIAAFLARTSHAQGRLDDAMHYTELSERLMFRNDIGSHIMWQGTRACVLAQRGESPEAERLAAGAVSMAQQTECVYLQAEALRDLAQTQIALGRPGAALDALGRAQVLHTRKRNHASAQAVAHLRETLVIQTDEHWSQATAGVSPVATQRKSR